MHILRFVALQWYMIIRLNCCYGMSVMVDSTAIQQAANLIQTARRIVVLTGAGVSKESGIPTFRDAQEGLWSKYDPTQLATPTAFRDNPKLVWDFYEFRRDMMRDKQPNPGHRALAELEQRFPTMLIVTQNIDELHEQAGSQNVIHLHGRIAQNKCFFNCQGNPTLVDISRIAWDKTSGPPACPHCGRWVRPNVVWFHEMLPMDELEQAQHASREADVILVIGTSGLVYPAANLPSETKKGGGKVIEVNPDYSMITRIADVKLEGPSGEVLPLVVAALPPA